MKTASEILEWVSETTVGRRAFEPTERTAERTAADTATAERLAYCVRVTELVEAGGTDSDTYSGMILRQAAQGEGK